MSLKKHLLSRRTLWSLAVLFSLFATIAGIFVAQRFYKIQKWEKVLAKINPACKPCVEWKNGEPVKIFFANPLRNFYLTDEDLAAVGQIPSLQWVYITYAPNITGRGLESLRNLKDLRVLTLYDTRINDNDLKYLKELTELRTLDLGGNKNITDSGLSHLTSLKKLRVLQIQGTGITDAGLRMLGNLPDLDYLMIGPVTEELSEEGIHKLRKSMPDCDILANSLLPCDLDVGKPSTATDLTFEDLKLPHEKNSGETRILVSEIKEPGLGALMIATVKKEQLKRFGLQPEDIQAAGPLLLEAVKRIHNSQGESFPTQAATMFLSGMLVKEFDKSKSDAINKILNDGIEIDLQFGLQENIEVFSHNFNTAPANKN